MSETWQPVYGLSNGRTGVNPCNLYENDAGDWEEPAPIACRHGHELGPYQVTVGWTSCPIPDVRGGHRTHTCLRCRAMGIGDPVIYTPPLDPDCPCTETGTRTFGDASNPA